MQEAADIRVIVCSGALCPIVYTEHVEEWDMPSCCSFSSSSSNYIMIETLRDSKCFGFLICLYICIVLYKYSRLRA
ncbi:MAG: hypothetical protein QXF59_05440 [Candidatus Bathyarchaeia archaeon]